MRETDKGTRSLLFQFSYDPDQILLHVVQQGYWSMPVFRDFAAEFLRRHDEIRQRHRSYRVMADCRDYAVQSAEIGQAFATLFETLMAQNRGHYAILAATTLNKLQAKRALPQDNVQVFTDWDDAMAWLLADGSLPD
jgi:hypothetical protein